MRGKNLRFAHAVVVEEAVRRLGGSPIAARQWDRSANVFGQLPPQHPKPLAQSFIGELTARQFLVDPYSHALGSVRKE